MMVRSLAWLVIGLVLITTSSCDVNPYTLGEAGVADDAGRRDGSPGDGASDGDGSPGDGGSDGDAGSAPPDACAGLSEACNRSDDDCDGMIDEGFNLAADPANCGACGNRCMQPNTAGTCTDS